MAESAKIHLNTQAPSVTFSTRTRALERGHRTLYAQCMCLVQMTKRTSECADARHDMRLWVL